MKAREIKKVNSFFTTALICREYIAIIAMMPAMMENVKKLDKLLLELQSSIEIQALPITHHAKEKMRLREEIAVLMDKISGIIRAYALSVGNAVIEGEFSQTYSQLFRHRALDLSVHCRHMIKFLDHNLLCFRNFGLKKDHLDQLKKLHKNFGEISPRGHRNIRTTQTTKLIPKTIAAIDRFIKEQMLPLIAAFEEFPAFSKAFCLSRKQIKYGRPKEVLKNKIKKYRSASALPRTRKSSKPVLQLKMVERELPEPLPYIQE
jgi:hypothetical protein